MRSRRRLTESAASAQVVRSLPSEGIRISVQFVLEPILDEPDEAYSVTGALGIEGDSLTWEGRQGPLATLPRQHFELHFGGWRR